MHALDELKTEAPYKDRFAIDVISMSTEKGEASKAKYAWGGDGHGLVVLGAKGEVLGKLKGHNYGRDEIVELLNGVK